MTTVDEKSQEAASANDPGVSGSGRRRQTLPDVLAHGEEPTEEFLEEFVALREAPPVSDEDLAEQALNHPGVDGDARTPE